MMYVMPYLVPRIRLRGDVRPLKSLLGRRRSLELVRVLVKLGVFAILNSSSTRGHEDKKITNQIHYLRVASNNEKINTNYYVHAMDY